LRIRLNQALKVIINLKYMSVKSFHSFTAATIVLYAYLVKKNLEILGKILTFKAVSFSGSQWYLLHTIFIIVYCSLLDSIILTTLADL
jgi:hypothetical protein